MKKRMNRAGFTIIELLVVIAIIAILIVIAVPIYQAYSKRAYFSEVVQATGPFKLGVENCYNRLGAGVTVANCGGGQNGVPADITSSAGNVGSITTSGNGIITATGSSLHNLDSETYILTPTATNNTLIWSSSGTCVNDSLC